MIIIGSLIMMATVTVTPVLRLRQSEPGAAPRRDSADSRAAGAGAWRQLQVETQVDDPGRARPGPRFSLSLRLPQ